MIRIAILTTLLLATGIMAGSATAQDTNLLAHCAPMELFVEDLDPEDTQATGLTKQAVMNAAEARLRSVRLLVPITKQSENPQILDREQLLSINITLYSAAFSILVELYRYMKDLGYGVPGFAVVWRTGSTGTHDGDGNYILGHVSQHLDKFLAGYLRANEGHCSG